MSQVVDELARGGGDSRERSLNPVRALVSRVLEGYRSSGRPSRRFQGKSVMEH